MADELQTCAGRGRGQASGGRWADLFHPGQGLLVSCAAPSPLTRSSCSVTQSPPSPGACQEAHDNSTHCKSALGEPRASSSQGQGGEKGQRLPGGLGEHQMFQKAWLYKFLASLLSVPLLGRQQTLLGSGFNFFSQADSCLPADTEDPALPSTQPQPFVHSSGVCSGPSECQTWSRC